MFVDLENVYRKFFLLGDVWCLAMYSWRILIRAIANMSMKEPRLE